jgi:hypothetical protein
MEYWQQVLDFIHGYAGVIAAGGALFGITAFVLAIAARSTIRTLTRPLRSFGDASTDPSRSVPAIAKAVEHNELQIEALIRSIDELRDKSRSFLQYKSLVRYDAFEDIGGQQSYSLCLLDGNKDGILITYLTGRNSTRSYTVSVKSGVASRKLSDEESRAMDEALTRPA